MNKGGEDEGGKEEENMGERKRRCIEWEMEGSCLGLAWPVLHNTDIHTYTQRDRDTKRFTSTMLYLCV